MAYLETPGEYEREIKRGIFSYRSSRLDAVIEAIAKYIESPSGERLVAITKRFEDWKDRDPKEFEDRGKRTEPQLRHEIRTHSKDLHVTIQVVDPDAHPMYQPWKWNDYGSLQAPLPPMRGSETDYIQLTTNCYAYACDDPYGHGSRPQPGEIAGRTFTALEQIRGPAVRMRVMFDDLCRAHNQERRLVPLIRMRNEPIPDYVVNVPGYYLVALFTAPNRDYHWVRQDRNGMWSHKPGADIVTNRDSDYKPIYDPRDAKLMIGDRRYQFTTFYYAPKGGVRTGSLGDEAIRHLWRDGDADVAW